MSDALLTITDLHIDVGAVGTPTHAVRGVDLSIARGQAVGLVGESGSGKTLTALAVLGLLPPSGRIIRGAVRFDGVELNSLGRRAREDLRGNRIGMVFQEPMTALNPTRRVGEQIAEVVRRHRRVPRREAWDQAVAMLDRVGIIDAATTARRYPHQLSGGQRQRVMIASAIVCQPDLLIADEPTTALDVTVQAQILDLIEDLRAQHGMALLLVTHDLGVVAGRVDHLAAMYSGRVVEEGPAATVLDRTRHPYLRALLDSTPERALAGGGRVRSIGGQPPDMRDSLDGCAYAARCGMATQRCSSPPPVIHVGTHRVECFHPVDTTTVMPPRGARPTRTIAPEPLLELVDVRRTYATGRGHVVRALDGVSLQVRRGETVGVVGESGSGKSTLGRIAVGLELPDAGAVRFDGVDVASFKGVTLRQRRARAQMVFQDSAAALDPRMQIGAAIAEPLAIQGIGRAERRARVAELLDAVGLPASASRRYPHEFSGGQRQRIVIARALAPSPTLVVADEPVSALDVSVQAQILNLLDDLRAERGLSYLFVSHDLSVIRYMADRVAVMYRGVIVESGPSGAVHDDPRHPYTRLLVDSIPSLEAAPTAPSARRVAVPSTDTGGCRFYHRCAHALDRCRVESPALEGDGERTVACHAPLTAKSATLAAQSGGSARGD